MSTGTEESPEYSVYVGNLDCTVPAADLEELIYELFLQAGPVEKVFIPSDAKTGLHKSYGFVEFDHKESVLYSIQLLNGICLFGRPLKVRTTVKVPDSTSTVDATAPHTDNLPSSHCLVNGDQHPTLGQRLSPLNDAHRPHPVLESSQSNAQSQIEPLLPPNPQSDSHPTLGQRLSPPVLPANKTGLGQRLSPLIPPNGALFPLLPPPPLPSNGPLPLFGSNLPPPPPPLWDLSTPNRGPPFFPPTQVPPQLSRPSLLNFPPPPPLPPLPPPPLPHVLIGDTAQREHFVHSGLPNSIPLFGGKNSDISDHQEMLSEYTTDVADSNKMHPLFPENGDEAIDTRERHVMLDNHTHLHRNRVVHIDDKPSWITQDTKEQIRDYHLHRLGETLSKYKQEFVKHRR